MSSDFVGARESLEVPAAPAGQGNASDQEDRGAVGVTGRSATSR